ncbi:MAG: hypothetical protein A2Y40_09260 [Candidatus Margulisbacteria bacterium GWF2_35_9]|nr:MAG: hypothetical protein A2Y40_09260 [Candidatus Margulisbacteria bacterium GWF2_35_9]
MKEFKTKDIFNISIIGSASIGKTSFADAVLYNVGVATRQGKVDDGTSLLDYESDEQSRKLTISSAMFHVESDDKKINFIDTPGYPAFVSQEISAINVCESSLVILGAVAGVEVLTKKCWKYSDSEDQSKFVFINMMDREGSDFYGDVEQARSRLSKKIYPIFLPIGNGSAFKGIVDIITQKAFYEGDGKITEKPIPDDMKSLVEKYRSELIEAVAENSEVLLEKYLESGELTETELMQGLKLGIISNDIVPLMAGSALANIGVKKCLEYIIKLAPNPEDKAKLIKCIDDKGQEELKRVGVDGPTLLQIFKITDEPKIGEFFYFKVKQGTVTQAQELIDTNSKQKERLGHLYVFNGKNREEVPSLYPGDIGATAKLKHIMIGDTLYGGKDNIQIELFKFPVTVITQAVEAHSEKDREKIGEGVQTLNKVDPCFQYENRAEFNEMVISGMSKLHIEIMVEKIKKKYNVEIELKKPKIPYRETIRKMASAQGKYKKQTGGHGQYGDCHIEIMPTPLGTGYSFVNKIVGGAIPGKYIPAVDKGVQDAMVKGILAGYPMVDIQVKLYDGTFHAVDSSDLAFQMAGRMAFKSAAEQAESVLLEPIMNVKVIVPDDYVGDVTADFNQRRGKIIAMEAVEDGMKMINVHVPMAEMYQYSIDLKSMTKGEGVYTKQFERYEQVPSSIVKQVIEENKVE